MKSAAAIVFLAFLMPSLGRAGELNLATLTCQKYENEVLPAAATNPDADSINTVMWLFGYSVARSRAHVMYPDALSPFGFALDGECKSNPAETLLDALSIVKPESKSPMDLANVECASFVSHHGEFERSDPESANTIMMWLFGFSVARSGGHLFDAQGLKPFHAKLMDYCAKKPKASLLDALEPPKKLLAAPKKP
jgi:HdeA/HdeB family